MSQENQPNRREFLKGAAALGASALAPEQLTALENEKWPENFKSQIESLEHSVRAFQQIDFSVLTHGDSIRKEVLDILKQRLKEAKKSEDNEIDKIARTLLNGKKIDKEKELLKRFERVESEIFLLEKGISQLPK